MITSSFCRWLAERGTMQRALNFEQVLTPVYTPVYMSSFNPCLHVKFQPLFTRGAKNFERRAHFSHFSKCVSFKNFQRTKKISSVHQRKKKRSA